VTIHLEHVPGNIPISSFNQRHSDLFDEWPSAAGMQHRAQIQDVLNDDNARTHLSSNTTHFAEQPVPIVRCLAVPAEAEPLAWRSGYQHIWDVG